MVSKKGCLQAQTAPNLEKGDTVAEGRFLRNLPKKGEVSKRYSGDNDDSPVYGFKLARKFWTNAVRTGDLSMNEQGCIVNDGCAIAVHPYAEKYFHIAILDLKEINNCLDGHSFVAQYDPLLEPPDGPNACHFELLPIDGSTQSLFVLQTVLDAPFPDTKMPDGIDNLKKAEDATKVYESVISIKRWVRSPEGELT